MNKIWKFFQYGYLLVAIVCLIEGIVRFNSDKEKALFFIGFSIFITLVFFFKRHFRKKIENRNKQNT
jgi:FtsH-binding integral membrane protein